MIPYTAHATAPLGVTWIIDGVAHDRVIWLSNVEPKVKCGHGCCCKAKP